MLLILALEMASAAPVTAANGPAAPLARATPAIPFVQALILIRSSLTALQQANESGSYITLQALGTQTFRTNYTPARLAQTFAVLRAYNLNSILVLEPQFTQVPVLSTDGSLAMSGYFVSEGVHINFQLAYSADGGHWRLAQINVGLQGAA